MIQTKQTFSPIQYLFAWMVHAFTGCGAFLGLWSLVEISNHHYTHALWLMAMTVLIDAIDGTFARLARVKSVLPKIDGALLDNIIDYLNYVITPCFFLIVKPGLLPPHLSLWIAFAITMTSAYQFCQSDAKTPDNFFKGFPCYWNFTLFYMLLFNTSMILNAAILIIFCILIFVPIKYVYPSRIDYLTPSKKLKSIMHIFSTIYGIATIIILWHYPEVNPICLYVSFGYMLTYFLLSFYRTYSPLILTKISTKKI